MRVLTVFGVRAILPPMRALPVIILLTALILPTVAFAEVQTFTATHTYILGDHDSKDDARQRCLLEAKRKILEQASVYIESDAGWNFRLCLESKRANKLNGASHGR
jgi:hypothetical protein